MIVALGWFVVGVCSLALVVLALAPLWVNQRGCECCGCECGFIGCICDEEEE